MEGERGEGDDGGADGGDGGGGDGGVLAVVLHLVAILTSHLCAAKLVAPVVWTIAYGLLPTTYDLRSISSETHHHRSNIDFANDLTIDITIDLAVDPTRSTSLSIRGRFHT